MTCLAHAVSPTSPLYTSSQAVAGVGVDIYSGQHLGYLPSLGDDRKFPAWPGGTRNRGFRLTTAARWPFGHSLPCLHFFVQLFKCSPMSRDAVVQQWRRESGTISNNNESYFRIDKTRNIRANVNDFKGGQSEKYFEGEGGDAVILLVRSSHVPFE